MTGTRVSAKSATLRVTMIQPSVPQNMIWDENENTNRFRQLLALTENALNESEGRVPRVPDLLRKWGLVELVLP